MLIEKAKKMPKAELHLHIEGSLQPELMMKLAKRNNISIPFKTVEEIYQAYHFSDLQSFLDIYYQGANVLLVEEDFFDLTWEYLEKCHQDHVVHTEIFFDPQTHTDRGVSFEAVVKGITRALDQAKQKWGISSELIMCFLRHLPEEQAFKTLTQAEDYLDNIIGVGLDSSEVGFPPQHFKRVFQKAKEMGLRVVAHAGEEGPPEYIWEALELLKAERIDHGVRCLEDDKLVDYLVSKNIPLTVCPLSNVKLKVFKKLSDHNLRGLLDRGLRAMINSDDPAYFGGFLNQNFEECIRDLNLTREEIITLGKNSFKSSFLPSEEIEKWCRNIDETF